MKLHWRGYALSIKPNPDRKFSEHALEEWARCQELGEGVSYLVRELGSPMPTHSLPALEAAKCAMAQGEERFDAFNMALMTAFFGEGKDISDWDVLKELVAKAGLDVRKFLKDYDSGAARALVIEDMNEFLEKRLDGVPTVIFSDDREGTIRVKGEVPYSQYHKLTKWLLST